MEKAPGKFLAKFVPFASCAHPQLTSTHPDAGRGVGATPPRPSPLPPPCRRRAGQRGQPAPGRGADRGELRGRHSGWTSVAATAIMG